MLYFFHVDVAGLRNPDLEGKDFVSLETAREDAIANARSVIADVVLRGGYLSSDDALEIADADGHVYERLRLDNLLKPPPRAVESEIDRQSVSSLAHAVRGIAGDLLAECLAVSKTPLGNVQIMDWRSGQLAIRAHQGFGPEFLDYFASVGVNDSSACSMAMRAHKPHIVGNVAEDPALEACASVLARAGVKAVQSTPILSSHGLLVGVVSTHFDKPSRPSEMQMQAISSAARKAADTIVRLRAEMEL